MDELSLKDATLIGTLLVTLVTGVVQYFNKVEAQNDANMTRHQITHIANYYYEECKQ